MTQAPLSDDDLANLHPYLVSDIGKEILLKELVPAVVALHLMATHATHLEDVTWQVIRHLTNDLGLPRDLISYYLDHPEEVPVNGQPLSYP